MKKLYSFNTRVILGIYRSFYLNTTRLMEDGKIGLKKNICKSFLYQVIDIKSLCWHLTNIFDSEQYKFHTTA